MKLTILFTGIFVTFLLSCSDGTKNYTKIIAEIEKEELPLGKLEKLKIEDSENVSTIKKISDDYTMVRGKEKGLIWVFKAKENLLVFIETKDDGHKGQYGVAYSETGETLMWNHDEWGEFWSTGEKNQ